MRKFLPLFFLLSSLSAVVSTWHLSQNNFSISAKQIDTQTFPHLIPAGFYPHRKAGFIDSSGKIVIPFQFQDAQAFSEGLAAVAMNDLWGFIDPTGKIVIPLQFKEVYSFNEGLAGVTTLENSQGYIDKTGKWVIPPQDKLLGANTFSAGLAKISNNSYYTTKNYSYIDRTGKIVIQLDKSYSLDDFSPDGLARVGKWDKKSRNGLKFGYIDRTGKLVIPLQYKYAERFSEGLAAVEIKDKWGYINTSGKVVIPAQFYVKREFSYFSQGLAAVCDYNAPIDSPCGYMDKNGSWVIPPQFKTATPFSENLAAVSIPNPKYSKDDPEEIYYPELYGYIDRTGSWVIPPKYRNAIPFKNGLGRVVEKKSQQISVINKKGNTVLKSPDISFRS